MHPESHLMINKFGPLALMGAGVFTAIGNPVTIAAISFASYKLGRSIYKKAKKHAKLKLRDEDYDLFI